MRQIILDTETTGLSPKDGHRIIEIAGIEIVNRFPTGKQLHYYFNPEREVEAGALQVHGLSHDMLAHKPLFSELIQEIIDFISGAELIIHNADFDVGFLNHEFRIAGKQYKRVSDYAKVFDTLKYARKKHPGQSNSLDALCRRYKVDNSGRTLHGALLDTQLLLEVFLAMTGEQMSLFDPTLTPKHQVTQTLAKLDCSERPPLPIIKASPEELQAHERYMAAHRAARD